MLDMADRLRLHSEFFQSTKSISILNENQQLKNKFFRYFKLVH